MKKIVCKECDKEIEGHTEEQLEHLLNQHMLAKHREAFIKKINEAVVQK